MAAVAGVILAGLAGAGSAAEAPQASETSRVTESAHYLREGRNQRVPDRVSTDVSEGDAGGRRSTSAPAGQQKLSAGEAQTPNTDFWFYTADVELFADDDRDGYYHGIDLLFDADTIYTRADVYAVVYLSRDGGPWIEYSATEDFTIWGATSDDDYVIVTELLSGFPRGSYDILIELFDAWDDSFVADFGPENTSELAFLPLEDAERDTPATGPTTVVVSRGGGGGVGWFAVVLLALYAAAAVRRRSALRFVAVPRSGRGPSA